MTHRLKRMLDGTRTLESRLAVAFDKAAETLLGAPESTPLEIVHTAADEIARHVQPAGRGRYTFPFNDVTLTFAAPTPQHRARVEALCAGPPSLRDRVASRLSAAGCDGTDFDLRLAFADTPDDAWTRPDFHVALSRVTRTPPAVIETRTRIEIIVTHGTADRGAYSLTTLPIAIGRGAEVRDHQHRLMRINHVAFTEGADEITQSVSRRHARIELDATGRPRVIDDNSAQGTSVIRHGRGIAVPRGSRGLGLQSGDEIAIGQARIKIRITKE